MAASALGKVIPALLDEENFCILAGPLSGVALGV